MIPPMSVMSAAFSVHNQIVQRQLREVDFVLVDGGVDVGVVAAVDDHAVVFTHDAADEVGTADAAGGGAVVDGAAAQVGTGDAAHNGCAGGNALEPAVDRRTGVAAYDAAYGAVRLPEGIERPQMVRSCTTPSSWM